MKTTGCRDNRTSGYSGKQRYSAVFELQSQVLGRVVITAETSGYAKNGVGGGGGVLAEDDIVAVRAQLGRDLARGLTQQRP